jgi:hypothetical protein
MDNFLQKGKVSLNNFKNMIKRSEEYRRLSGEYPSYINIDGCNPQDVTHFEIPDFPYFYNGNPSMSGAVCLKMMLDHIGCKVPLRKIVRWSSPEQCSDVLDGLRNAVIQTSFNCNVRLVLLDITERNIKNVYHTYICHGQPVLVRLRTKFLSNYSSDHDHFCVISGFNSKFIILSDPSRGVNQEPLLSFNHALKKVKFPNMFVVDIV